MSDPKATNEEAALLLALLENKNNVNHSSALHLASRCGCAEPERTLEALKTRRWVIYAMSVQGGFYGTSDAGYLAARKAIADAVAAILVPAGVIKTADGLRVSWIMGGST